MLRRITAILMVLVCWTVLPTALAEDALLLHAVEMAADMDTLAESPLYMEAMNPAGEVRNLVAQFAEGEYAAPSAVWRTQLKPDALLPALSADGESQSEEALVARELLRRTSDSCVNMLNAREGVTAVAASAILTVSRAFPMEELESGCLYLLQYEKGLSVAVSFWPEGDGVVSAVARFMLADDPAEAFRQEELALMFTLPEAVSLEN